MTSKIKHLRIQNKKKQEDMAELLNISKANYSKKENGKLRFSLSEAYQIAQFYNKSIEDIFFKHEVSNTELS